jgi:hypothetical protein
MVTSQRRLLATIQAELLIVPRGYNSSGSARSELPVHLRGPIKVVGSLVAGMWRHNDTPGGFDMYST